MIHSLSNIAVVHAPGLGLLFLDSIKFAPPPDWPLCSSIALLTPHDAGVHVE